MLGICHGVLADQFIFRHILGGTFSRGNRMSMSAFEVSKIPKRKTKRQKKYNSQVCRFCWLVCRIWKIIKILAKTVLKINWSVKTPGHERMEVARSGLWAPGIKENARARELLFLTPCKTGNPRQFWILDSKAWCPDSGFLVLHPGFQSPG